MDFVLFVGDFLLPGGTPVKHFRLATQIFLTLDNQNNAIRGETVSHFRSESAASFPVQAVIDIFLQLHDQGCNPTTSISNFPSDHGIRSVSASNIISVIRSKFLQVGAARLGFSLEHVVTHYLQSSGAMAMHLVNVPDRTFLAIGR